MRLSVGFLLLLLSLLTASAGTIVQFRTTLGDFDVELYDADKPVTVSNFLQYVQGGYYTNMFFHRVVPNFVMQGGGFRVVDGGITNVTTSDPITNEFGIGTFYSNVYGTIAMAKTTNANSATSQFFFNLADNSTSLDDTNNSGGFTVFGHVVAGTNVLNHFLVSQSNHLLQEVNAGGVLAELPVLAVNNLTLADLIYVAVHTAPHYTPLKATYNGLFEAPRDVSLAAGSITLTTTTGPKFTGSVRLGPTRYSFSGAFDTNGFAVVTATSGSSEPLVLNLHPDALLGTDKLVGSISTAEWVAQLEAYRPGFDARLSPATNYAGKYTLTLPPSGQTNAPAGYGFAALSVTTAGKVTIKGSLADGSAFSQTASLSRDGLFPLYAPLYANRGYLSGWVALTNPPGAEVGGSVLWFKPLGTEFVSTLNAAGGRYTVPAPGVNLLSATNAFAFGGDSSTLAFTNTLILKPGNKLFNTSTNKLSISLMTSSGLFSGSVKPPGSAHSIPFKGALWQGSGYGYFLDAGQTGSVLLQP